MKDDGMSIDWAKTVLGIELGSTRIKAVLLGEDRRPMASGSYEWENRLEGGIWTYRREEIWSGLQESYRKLATDVRKRYGQALTKVGAIGISGMMHGYMAFDRQGELLAPFRTWRNTITQEASDVLSEAFSFHIPQRWSVAHLYQAILNKEAHVGQIDYLATLACYIHWKLTGERVAGVGEASGMFPIDSAAMDYDTRMVGTFDELIAERGLPWKLRDIMPRVLAAGENGGRLSAEGAKLLDPTGTLAPGIPFCPPEGDAGTGMAATNSVARRTGNVSAGTSIFAMIVLEKPLTAVYPEIDMVTTPAGDPVAMVHCNNCTSDLNAWVNLFSEFLSCFGEYDKNTLFPLLFQKALEGEKDCGGLMACNYFSGEHVTGFSQGRPLFVRSPEGHFTLANFMRTHLYSALGTLRMGLDILYKQENVGVDSITGHGGFFKTKGVGQQLLAAAMRAPVSVMETAGEGGAYGIALLASYMLFQKEGQSLEAYLADQIFDQSKISTLAPTEEDMAGFEVFLERYRKCLNLERAAVDNM